MRDSERSITQNTYGVAVVLSSLLCTYTQQYGDFVQTDSLEQCTYAAVQQILFKRSQEQTCCFTFWQVSEVLLWNDLFFLHFLSTFYCYANLA